ncbi:hypothetical protein GCK72_019239 [Caenorhabditis remanei]|nr:hypothetical protein GCK72_019239 [Caenorhabditis remanei]KAF1752684.1 hypothetical protein GCK72_019239 [Caenorhabditis remanei]
MIPWTALVCPIMYSLYANKYDYYNQALNNFSMLLMASHGLMSTTCTLLLIRPYREFVMSVFRGNREYDAKMMWATNIRSQGSVMLGSATE